jgi:hypothetical protein
MTAQDIKRLRVKTEIVRRYYVQLDDWIYAGPFDTKEEAQQALADAKETITL